MDLTLQKKGNRVDDFTDALLNIMKYGDSEVDYPDFKKAAINDGVVAEWFYPLMNGNNDFSELTAIHMYTSQEAKFEEIGELMLGISLVEMKHYARLMDFVLKIGGRIDQRFDNTSVVIGENAEKAIDLAIKAEEKTIEECEKLQMKLLGIHKSATVEIALQLLSKIVADEQVHLTLLTNTKNEKGD